MSPDDSLLDLAEIPQRPADPFHHSSLPAASTDIVALGCLLVGTYLLVFDSNLLAFILLFFAFAFLFRPFHPH